MKLSEMVCRTCGTKKDISCFSFREDSKKPRSQCKQCRVIATQKYLNRNPEKMRKNTGKKYFWKSKEPWKITLYSIQWRCGRYKSYINRKCLITEQELKYLWFRDKAFLLKSPSIDRIDNSGNYTLENCRYIERLENLRLGWAHMTHTHKNKRIGQYKDGGLIATYESAKKASEETGLCLSTIYHTVGGRYKKTEGFMWRYL